MALNYEQSFMSIFTVLIFYEFDENIEITVLTIFSDKIDQTKQTFSVQEHHSPANKKAFSP